MAVVFFSYSHKDEPLRDRLEVHLAMLKRQGIIETWHDRRIVAGDEFHNRIGDELDRADAILLLVSPDFLASDYCYDVEVARAMQRHEAGAARVIPVVLRPCDWHSAPFGKLNAAPRDGKPISTWPDLDEAFLDVVKAIKAALVTPAKPASGRAPPGVAHSAAVMPASSSPRSSNLRVKKQFTDADKDRHLDESFEYMARFFEGSLHELEQRNAGLQTAFRRIDADSFTAVVYRDGKTVAECRISRGGWIDGGITYSSSARRQGNGINESLSIEADGQSMFLKPMMSMHRMDSSEDAKLTFEGAAEYYWSMLIERLQ
jgi:hypothetical protein